ncbi:hypothetical protein E6C27_scaffold768G00080 [Cucumis melo var. makuwa]|uniref:Uncharacterized protein n=1 Tax=Cucumis melo var. makuwa TaxID=1194695 RepID=A0A5A7TFV4_CUCMM|nr:hypothetical protein E6C27_scaffold768G00080 [Cucumis melo var. makuwa]
MGVLRDHHYYDTDMMERPDGVAHCNASNFRAPPPTISLPHTRRRLRPHLLRRVSSPFPSPASATSSTSSFSSAAAPYHFGSPLGFKHSDAAVRPSSDRVRHQSVALRRVEGEPVVGLRQAATRLRRRTPEGCHSWLPDFKSTRLENPLPVDPLSVDSIEGHNLVSGKGFPTTGPRIEAGNVVIHRGLHVTRPLVVACVPSGRRNCVRIGTDVRGSHLSGFWSWSLVVEGRLICASFGSTRLIRASFGSTRLICASFGITRLIGVSFGITRLICAFYGTTRLLCKVRAQRGADRREAGRMREGHMDASGNGRGKNKGKLFE